MIAGLAIASIAILLISILWTYKRFTEVSIFLSFFQSSESFKYGTFFKYKLESFLPVDIKTKSTRHIFLLRSKIVQFYCNMEIVIFGSSSKSAGIRDLPIFKKKVLF